jgi:type II secretory pathway pseudopilin PulG
VGRIRNDDGFLMMELLMAMVLLSVALTALVVVFTTGQLAMRKASQVTTAAMLADAQMETYRAMTSRDIGLDTSAGTVAALDTTYKNDAACANASTTTTCAASGVSTTEIGPTGATPNTCASINLWYPNTLPCTPSRTVTTATTPASPDGRSYRVDTYIVLLAATTTGVLQRARKQVTVVVRDGALLGRVLARGSSIFDCSTGVTPASIDC